MEPAPRWAPVRGAIAAGLAVLLLAGVGLALDLDLDGDLTAQEMAAGTLPWDGDTDGDGLEDGWERAAGLDGLAADTEGDGVRDGDEVRLGADPKAPDSDGDGLSDRDEASLADCDGDGLRAIAEGDGDADGRVDALEAGPDRCDRDADADGVLDGSEGNARCVHAVDCDGDGLADGTETDGFDALDPDSFGSGVSDGISFAFEQSGQPPGADDDDDGIPDGWEGEDGLIVWGELRPQAGRRDLLVEFLRVQGPDSGAARYASASFAPAYGFVADALRAGRGLELRWVETIVTIDDETDPELIPQLEDPYYADVLAQGRYSTNPYVTTVVLNPQHDQSELLHAGVAPIRGMLAAVDYGSHLSVSFTNANGTVALQIYPVVESMIRGGRQDLLADLGFQGGYTQAGEMGLVDITTDARIIWTPSWFRVAPRIVTPDDTVQMHFEEVTVYSGSLAGTILHELGHTLGLCHAHEPDCNARFSAVDRANQAESIMSYDNPGNDLQFLGSEWTTVLQYVSCPPDQPVTRVAEGAGDQEVLAAKYAYSNKDVLAVDLRSCNDLTPVPRTFQPNTPLPSTYFQPRSLADPADEPAGPALAAVYLVGALGLAVAAAVVGGRWRRRTLPPDGNRFP